MSAAVRAPVELMKTLDEKFVAHPVLFAEAALAISLILDGGALRTASGDLDRDLVRDLVRMAIKTTPSLATRIRNTPFGLTTPAWVSTEVSLDYHVRFAEGDPVTQENEARLFAGRPLGPMSIDRPLWDLLISELASGEIAVIVRCHHAFGDGIFGLGLLSELIKPFSYAPDGNREISEPERPRSGFGMLVSAGQVWLSEFPLGPAAWNEYWRKPYRKRLKRWGGRILRPAKVAFWKRVGLPGYLEQRQYQFKSFDLREVKTTARELGGSISDLIVAAALAAVSEHVSNGAGASLLVPISRRTGTTGAERNHISMARVSTSLHAQPAQLVADVHAQIEEAVLRKSAKREGERAPSGYATYLPAGIRPVFLGPAPVQRMVLWPSISPLDPIAVLASSYESTLTIAVTANQEIDIDAVFSTISAVISDQVRGTV